MRLTSVVVLPPRQAGPKGLLKRVCEELENDPSWDEIYCVLDHDGRDKEIETFRIKLSIMDKETGSCRIEMILSNPCFEFWLLLHFELTTRPFVTGSGGTACQSVIKRLRHHIPKYPKNDANVFGRCRKNINTAVANAEKLQRTQPPYPQPHTPYTGVARLVKRLFEISGK